MSLDSPTPELLDDPIGHNPDLGAQAAGLEGEPGVYPDKPLTQYLNQAGRRGLLTKEQEARLARRVRAGDERAREEFTEANLRLVVGVARDYQNRGLEMEDLVQVGNMGLMRAVDTFDPQKGNKFSTYAWTCIRRSIIDSIHEQGRTIRVPPPLSKKLAQAPHAERELAKKLGRDPTEEELASHLKVSLDRFQAARQVQRDPFSIDGDEREEGRRLIDTLVDTRARSVSEEVTVRDFASQVRQAVQDVLETFSERERLVIAQRYGLTGEESKSLDEVGRALGVTRERVRQIQKEVEKDLFPALKACLEDRGIAEHLGSPGK